MTARSVSPLEPTAGTRGRILIVESNRDVARTLKTVATTNGFQVVGVCSNAREGLQAAAEMRPSLVLSGVFFNGEPEGIEFSRCVQEGLRVPVIFVGEAVDPLLMLQVAMAQPAGYISDARDSGYVGAVLSRALRGVRSTVDAPF